jgi:hypothetical protein
VVRRGGHLCVCVGGRTGGQRKRAYARPVEEFILPLCACAGSGLYFSGRTSGEVTWEVSWSRYRSVHGSQVSRSGRATKTKRRMGPPRFRLFLPPRSETDRELDRELSRAFMTQK